MNNARRAERRSLFEPGTETPLQGIGTRLPSALANCGGGSPGSIGPMMAEDEGASSDDASSEKDTIKAKTTTIITINEADSITFSALPPPQMFR